jgi:hypothetical protein
VSVFNAGDTRLSALGTSYTVSHTSSSGADRAILLVARDGNYAPTMTFTATYAGGSLSAHQDANGQYSFYRVAQATGPNNLVVAFSAYGSVFAAHSDWTGVDQATPLGTLVSNSGTSSAPTTGSVTCPAGGAIWAVEYNGYTGGGSFSCTDGTFIAHQRSAGGGHATASGYRNSTGSVTWAIPGSVGWTTVALPINPAASGTTVAITQVTETDSAQAFTARRTLAIGQVTETDLSQALTARLAAAIGQVTETDSADWCAGCGRWAGR